MGSQRQGRRGRGRQKLRDWAGQQRVETWVRGTGGARSAISGFWGIPIYDLAASGSECQSGPFSHPAPAYGAISSCRVSEGARGLRGLGRYGAQVVAHLCRTTGGSLRYGRGRRAWGESEVGELVRGVTGRRDGGKRLLKAFRLSNVTKSQATGPWLRCYVRVSFFFFLFQELLAQNPNQQRPLHTRGLPTCFVGGSGSDGLAVTMAAER